MFKEPITEIVFEKVKDFCDQKIPQGLWLDYKEDFPQNLENTISAFANTYGGLILIGIEEDRVSGIPISIKGIPLRRGLEERVTSIAYKAIHPPIIPEVKVCKFASAGSLEPDRAVVVIRAPEGPDIYTVENRTKLYIRVNKQNEPATPEQIIELKARREKAAENRHRMIMNAIDRCFNVWRLKGFVGEQGKGAAPMPMDIGPSRMMMVVPLFPREPLVSLEETYTIAKEKQRELQNTLGGIRKPRPAQGGAIFEPYSADRFRYMEINQMGLVFYTENLVEDEKTDMKNTVNIWWTGKVVSTVLKCALDCYEKMGFWGYVDMELQLSQIDGRGLSPPPNWPQDLFEGCICYDKSVPVRDKKSVFELKEVFPDVVKHFVKEFAWAFGCNVEERLGEKSFQRLLEEVLGAPNE